MSHTAPGNIWPSTEINFPAAAQLESGHQKRALSEWPHPACGWGQQQEVDVTIDRLWVISAQPQAPIHHSVKLRATRLFTAILLAPINEQSEFMKLGLFLLTVFVYCSGVVVLVSHSPCWKDHWVGIEKKHTECYSNWGSHKPSDPFGILVRTDYIHIGIHHTNKLERAHHSQKSNTCTRAALEPQQSAAVLMGATCCYCGLCGKAGLLPALQPAATEWTQYPDSRSHGAQASGPPLPACPTVSAAFNHSSFFLAQAPGATPFNANQCQAARMPHTAPVTEPQRTSPCFHGRMQKIRPISPHYFLHQINRHKPVFALFFCAACVNKRSCSWFTVKKIKHNSHIFQSIK